MKRALIDLEDKRGQSNKTFGSKAPNSVGVGVCRYIDVKRLGLMSQKQRGSISPTFIEQLLRTKIPDEQKDS